MLSDDEFKLVFGKFDSIVPGVIQSTCALLYVH